MSDTAVSFKKKAVSIKETELQYGKALTVYTSRKLSQKINKIYIMYI